MKEKHSKDYMLFTGNLYKLVIMYLDSDRHIPASDQEPNIQAFSEVCHQSMVNSSCLWINI